MKRSWNQLGVALYNSVVTHIPFYAIRHGVLRLWGAQIGTGSAVFRGTTVFGIDRLRIGTDVILSFRCLLDARGGLSFGDNVVVASDVHFLTGEHLPDSDTFEYALGPIVIEDFAWIASRATVLSNVTVGRGAVVGAVSLVREDIAECDIVAGVPAQVRGHRTSALTYAPNYRPPFY